MNDKVFCRITGANTREETLCSTTLIMNMINNVREGFERTFVSVIHHFHDKNTKEAAFFGIHEQQHQVIMLEFILISFFELQI